jgi:hypothetical protein
MKTHAIWILDSESGDWYTDGIPIGERTGVKLLSELREHGVKCLSLPIGKEPKHLHPADRPILVRT